MTEPATAALQQQPRTWVIEVCKTCDRLAQAPFCAHRTTGLNDERWTEIVRVKEMGRRGR